MMKGTLNITLNAMLKVIFRLIFLIALIFFIISLWTLTIGQEINYEFKDSEFSSNFYNIILQGMPIAILLSLFGTLKKHHRGIRKVMTILATIILTLSCFIFLLHNLFTFGFGTWATINIAYEHKESAQWQIRVQRYDAGALGYGEKRIVAVKPFAGVFWKVSPVDTTQLDKTNWRWSHKAGEIKLP